MYLPVFVHSSKSLRDSQNTELLGFKRLAEVKKMKGDTYKYEHTNASIFQQ